jgi:hypothetical protein
MNEFLKDIYEGESTLGKLEDWTRDFWELDESNADPIFAQKGYEEKGCGHIERIISNVGEFLEKYFSKLGELNGVNIKIESERKEFFKKMKTIFKPSLVLLYVAIYLHDIGMRCPGIFKALSRFVKGGGENALHISKIVHEHHHYASFIILMELTESDTLNEDNRDQFAFLSQIPAERFRKVKDYLNRLNVILEEVANNICFNPYFGVTEKSRRQRDFKVIYAILSLLHKEVDVNSLRSILKQFQQNSKISYARTIESFNKWWGNIERGRKWNERTRQRFFRAGGNGELPADKDYEVLMIGNSSEEFGALDLLLIEALLQYGDKTDITIARLAREHEGYYKIPLDVFCDDIEYDNKNYSMCNKMAQQVVSDFARLRACSFIPVLLITIDGNDEKSEKSPDNIITKPFPELNIVIHYLRFENDEDIFRFVRLQDEKDFFDLQFLDVIRFHIPLTLRLASDKNESFKNPVFNINFKKEEHQIGERDELAKLFKVYPYAIESMEDLCRLLERLYLIPRDLGELQKIADEKFCIESAVNLKTNDVKNIIRVLPSICSGRENLINLLREFRLNRDKEEFFSGFKIHLGKIKNEIAEKKKLVCRMAYLMLIGMFYHFGLDENTRKEELLKQWKDGDIVDNNIWEEAFLKILPFSFENRQELTEFMGMVVSELRKHFKEDVKVNDSIEFQKLSSIKSRLMKSKAPIVGAIKEFPDTVRGLNRLIKKIEDRAKNNKDPFPYTAVNRRVIDDAYQFYRDQLKKELKERKQPAVFYETSDLIVPASFEILAVLNLFFGAEEA